MTTDDLRTLLRTEVLADEPPFGMGSAPSLVEGHRLVRRRRLLAGAGVAAVILAAGATGIARLPSAEDRQVATMPPAAREVLEDFDPDTFPSIVDAEVRSVVGHAIPPDVEGRIEPRFDGYVRLLPEDYRFTDSWMAEYELSPTDDLEVLLRYDQSANEGSAEAYCQENLAAGEMDRCTVDVLEDGSITISSVSGGPENPRDRDEPGQWRYAQQVVHRRTYGFGVIARERVKASTLAEADRRWSLTIEQLAAVATLPRLVFDAPPLPDDCGVGYVSNGDPSSPQDLSCD